MKINNPKTFWGGVMVAVIGGTFALIARGLKLGDSVLIPGYAMGVPARMGPADLPEDPPDTDETEIDEALLSEVEDLLATDGQTTQAA